MSFLRIPGVACPARCGCNGSVALHFARGPHTIFYTSYRCKEHLKNNIATPANTSIVHR